MTDIKLWMLTSAYRQLFIFVTEHGHDPLFQLQITFQGNHSVWLTQNVRDSLMPPSELLSSGTPDLFVGTNGSTLLNI